MQCASYIVFIVVVHLSMFEYALAGRSKIITLTDDNWKQCLDGEWMIKFYAPWCPACQANEPQFRELSEWSDELNVKVATVDITNEPGLSGRFMVTALPTFYHAKDGKFRRYANDRSASAMEEYIESKAWKTQEPISWLRHPDSIQMSIMSLLFKTSIVMKSAHESLTEKYGFSTWMSYAVFGLGTLVAGLSLGLILVCIVDFLFPPKPKPADQEVEVIKGEEKKVETEESGAETQPETEDEENLSQDEGPTQKTSQDWETIQDSEVEGSQQVRQRHVEKNEDGGAGDTEASEDKDVSGDAGDAKKSE